MQAYNILLLGSGGRECAFAWKLKQSQRCRNLYIAPGNAGTLQYGTNVAISPTDFEAIKSFCLEQDIHILLPGSEEPLVLGIYDFFKKDASLQHIIVAGPSQGGAQLEGSKAFSKRFMQRHNIPTAAYATFNKDNYEEGIAYLRQHTLPIVLKADGLAAGKGVVICDTVEDALTHFESMIQQQAFGTAGNNVVVEQFLEGIELSVFVLTNGKDYALLPEAKDYKRIGEGDKGLNTGGMGAISPVPFADADFIQKVKTNIIEPTIKGLSEEQLVYNGFIFFGLIKVNQEPYVIEYNCRMGDPETEVVMPRLENDLVALLLAMHEGTLQQQTIHHDARAACTVMLVSAGYPGSYEKNKAITGLKTHANSVVFHAGTKMVGDDVLTNGGRVLSITSYGSDLQQALQQSYAVISDISFEGKTYRKDIGYEFV